MARRPAPHKGARPGDHCARSARLSDSASKAHSGTVIANSKPVLMRSSTTRGRKTRLQAVSQPLCSATQTMKPSGTVC
jgi:hypothetical protein